MARRKEAHGGGHGWFVTFADLMGLLVGFFVMLVAFSTQDQVKLRIVAGSILAFWAGDFLNSFVLAKMKILTRGRFLWTRTIGSTMAGQAIDSLIFYPVAFSGLWTTETMLRVVAFNWVFKVGVEALFTPVTYVVVGALKRAEREDFYDVDTDFTPFSLED